MNATFLFRCGVEKTFFNITKLKNSGDLKHWEFEAEDIEGNAHSVTISKDDVVMIDRDLIDISKKI